MEKISLGAKLPDKNLATNQMWFNPDKGNY